MATTFWWPDQVNTAQVDSLTVGGTPAAGNTISAVVGISPNLATVTYTLVGGDTVNTAAAALQALLTNSSIPQFKEITWTVSNAVITATAGTAGTPFSLAASVTGGGATLTRASVTANTSQSDVADSQNWLRNNAHSLPLAGDDLIVSGSSVPLLWNLSSLSAVGLNSYQRWQDFTGQIGLLTVNPSGYQEYRPTYFKLGSNVVNLPVLIGQGVVGSGPTLERYDFGAARFTATILAAGGATDVYNVRILGTYAANVVSVANGVSCAVAMQAGEVADLASATALNGASLSLGSGVVFTGQLTVDGARAVTNCAPGTILAQNGSQVIVQGLTLTYGVITAKQGSTFTWVSDSTISQLNLQTGSVFDKSLDSRTMVVTNGTFDGDTTVVNDPYGVITYTNAVTVTNAVQSGPFVEGAGRTWKVT